MQRSMTAGKYGLIAAFTLLFFLAGFALDSPHVEAARANQVVTQAKRWLGYPYIFGANGPSSGAFDCSSFTRYVYRKVGVSLPRTSRAQSRIGKRISSTSSLRTGDLVFFDASPTRGARGAVDHVAIYIGNGRIIHTYKRGVGVTIEPLGKWRSSFLFGRRVL